MKVFLLGATGYLGTAIDEALKAHGHQVIGAARSDGARAKLAQCGTQSVAADAAKPVTLTEPAKAADAVIYVVQVTDNDPLSVDGRALQTIGQALAGSGKPFIYCSGCWVYGSTAPVVADEKYPLNPAPIVAHRPQLEKQVLGTIAQGIRPMIVRPAIVYGRGGGIPAMLATSARERGAATILGDGTNHWSVVDARDCAEVFALALERGQPGGIYNAAADVPYKVQEIAEAASRGAGRDGATVQMAADQVRALLGPFGDALLLDQLISAPRAKAELGWKPQAASILEDLERGSYATGALNPEVVTGD